MTKIELPKFGIKALDRLISVSSAKFPYVHRQSVDQRIDVIDASGLFDVNWYIERYRPNYPAEERENARAAIKHYIEIGDRAGNRPHPLFDPKWLTQINSYQSTESQTLLEKFIESGPDNSFTPLFDPAWYRIQVNDLGSDDPLLHFLRTGAAMAISPHPLFDSKYYFSHHSQLPVGGINPLTHFVEYGARNGYNPNAFFDASWYLSNYPNLEDNPLVHFITVGAGQGAQPHPALNLTQFSAQHMLEPLAAFIDIVKSQKFELIKGPKTDSTVISGFNATSRDSLARDQFNQTSVVWSQTPIDSPVLPSNLQKIDVDIDVNIDQAGIEIASFDVWDTLLRRDCSPDEVKARSARWLCLNAYHSIRPAFRSVRSLLAARINAENISAPNDEFEYRFELAIEEWLTAVTIRGTTKQELASLKRRLLAHELSAEISCTRPDVPMRNAVTRLRVPVVFASDFYMPSSFIESLLRHHGFGERFCKGYVSSDYFETKRSGKLFDRLIRELGSKSDRMLHVGDNEHADVDMARTRGIRTLHYTAPSEIERRNYFDDAFFAWRSGETSMHHERIVQLCAEVADAQNGPGAELRAIGARLAPLAVGYILDVLEHALKDDVKKVFFFTREGLFLRQLYDAVVAANPYDIVSPESEILEVSRRATFAASIDDINVSELMRLWTLYSRQSIKGLVSSLNLDETLVRDVCRAIDLSYDSPIEYPWQNGKVLNLIKNPTFLKHARARCAEQKARLHSYLVKKGVNKSPICFVVDIGWRGTIHDNIACLFKNVYFKGHYLGLFRYLNKQATNVGKVGWLFDENSGQNLSFGDVAALEMFTNGEGGSVIGYRDENGLIVAEKQIIESEESVIKNDVSMMQRGVMAAVDSLVKYVRLHGLTAEDLVGLARAQAVSLSTQPPARFADAFNRLQHNEAFGTGETQAVGGASIEISSDLATKASSELHYTAKQKLAGLRWPEAQIFSSATRDWWDHAPTNQRLALPAEFVALSAPVVKRLAGSRLSVYVPAPLVASGGHRTIFNVVRRLVTIGLKAEIFLEGIGAGIECVEDYLGGTTAVIHTQWHRHIPAEVALATIAHSSEFISQVNANHKGYLVQDFEALFNPMSDGYLASENSYAHGHQHFTIGNWLSHVINLNYRAPAVPAGLGVDTNVYRVIDGIKRERAVCFLYQPDKPRRAPLLGISALRILREMMPDVKIYVYGSDLPLHLDFEVDNIGLIHDLSELNLLYNRCKVGLCISGSNPSRIPYEMMAGGCVPVDLYRYNNLMDHKPGTSLLAYQDAASLAEAMHAVLNGRELFSSMSRAAIEFASSRTLEWESDVIANALVALAEGKLPPEADVRLMYDHAPVISKRSGSSAVDAFCAMQLTLAQRRLPSIDRADLPSLEQVRSKRPASARKAVRR